MRISSVGLAVLVALGVVACGGSGSTTITNASRSGGAGVSGSGAATATVTQTATVAAGPPTGATNSAQSGSGGVGLSTNAASAGAATSAPPCRASGLALSLLGEQGATGHGELGFALRNSTSASCSTVGYPGVQFLDRGGAALPTDPSHTTSDFFGQTELRQLIVKPGQSVSFRLGVTHGAGSSADCTTAYAVQVIAPNDTATLRTALPGGATECAVTTVSPLQAGDSAYR